MVEVQVPIVQGRTCGQCTLCCKVLKITDLEKPQGQWCPHCDTRRGCKTYETRPSECRSFHCGYLVLPDLDEHWKPDRSKIILVSEFGSRITAHVDPARPDAWRREPYYSRFKQWAAQAVMHQGQIAVCIGRHTYIILPDRDEDMGLVQEDEYIVAQERMGPNGTTHDIMKLKRDDPRLGALKQSADQVYDRS